MGLFLTFDLFQGYSYRMASTVSELSRLTGFSTATVSRVLNNSAFVSPEKREVVLKAVRETSYLNNRRRGRRMPVNSTEVHRGISPHGLTVEIVQHRHSPVEQISIDSHGMEVNGLVKAGSSSMFRNSPLSNSFYRHILDGAVQELAHWGARAQLSFNDDLLAPDFLARISTPARNGLLLLGETTAQLDDFLSKCVHPIVLLDLPGDRNVDVVTIDNQNGISQSFDYLYGLGHRRIGFVGRLDENFAYAERFTTFKWKMAEAGLTVRDDWGYAGRGPMHVDASTSRMREVLSRDDRPTALLCSNDWVALGAIRAANELGLSIPRDLSIVGFDDIEAAAIVTPALTSVHVPVEEIGRRGVRQLMIQMHDKRGATPGRGCKIRLEGELVVRGSTGRCA